MSRAPFAEISPNSPTLIELAYCLPKAFTRFYAYSWSKMCLFLAQHFIRGQWLWFPTTKRDFRTGLWCKQMQISLAVKGHVTNGERRHWMIVGFVWVRACALRRLKGTGRLSVATAVGWQWLLQWRLHVCWLFYCS